MFEPERYELNAPQPYRFSWAADFCRPSPPWGRLLVVATLRIRSRGSRVGRGGGGCRAIASWLHRRQGHVTVYRQGRDRQNIRTSLTQTVADRRTRSRRSHRRRTGADAVRSGTFGSRTAPTRRRFGERAATARQMLVDQVATLADRRSMLDAKRRRVVARRASSRRGSPTARRSRARSALARADGARSVVARGKPAHKVDGRAFVPVARVRRTSCGRTLLAASFDPWRGATPRAVADTKRALAGVTVVRDGNFIGVVAPREARRGGRGRIDRRVGSRRGQPPRSHLRPSKTMHERGQEWAASPGTLLALTHRRRASSRRVIAFHPSRTLLEPRSAVAEWADGGHSVVRHAAPFGVRSEVAQAFRLGRRSGARDCADMGSASAASTPACTRSGGADARAAGRPVKIVYACGRIRNGATSARSASSTCVQRRRQGGFRPGVPRYNSGRPDCERHASCRISTCSSRRIRHSARARIAGWQRRQQLRARNALDARAHIAGRADAVAFRLAHRRRPPAGGVDKRRRSQAGRSRRHRAVRLASRAGREGATSRPLPSFRRRPRASRDGSRSSTVRAIVNPDGLPTRPRARSSGPRRRVVQTIGFADRQISNGTMAMRVTSLQRCPADRIVLLDRRDLPSAGAGRRLFAWRLQSEVQHRHSVRRTKLDHPLAHLMRGELRNRNFGTTAKRNVTVTTSPNRNRLPIQARQRVAPFETASIAALSGSGGCDCRTSRSSAPHSSIVASEGTPCLRRARACDLPPHRRHIGEASGGRMSPPAGRSRTSRRLGDGGVSRPGRRGERRRGAVIQSAGTPKRRSDWQPSGSGSIVGGRRSARRWNRRSLPPSRAPAPPRLAAPANRPRRQTRGCEINGGPESGRAGCDEHAERDRVQRDRNGDGAERPHFSSCRRTSDRTA